MLLNSLTIKALDNVVVVSASIGEICYLQHFMKLAELEHIRIVGEVC